MPETRTVPLADILSVTTPYLMSKRLMQGVCDLVDWMTFGDPTPDRIDLDAWSTLKMRTDLARRSLLRQHRQLEGVCPRTQVDEADLIAWLIEQERVFGAELAVERAEAEMREVFEAVCKMAETMTEGMRAIGESLNRAFAPAAEAFAQLGEQFAQMAGEIALADRRLIEEHPDLAEVEARLNGFYGDPDTPGEV